MLDPSDATAAALGGADKAVPADVAVRNLLDGRFRVSTVAYTSGDFLLKVALDGKLVAAGEPIPVSVAPGELSPAHFAVWGPGATQPVQVEAMAMGLALGMVAAKGVKRPGLSIPKTAGVVQPATKVARTSFGGGAKW